MWWGLKQGGGVGIETGWCGVVGLKQGGVQFFCISM